MTNQIITLKLTEEQIQKLGDAFASNKSSKVKTKLSKNSDIIYAGNVSSNGLIEVTTEYGNGWVESHLIH